MGFRKLLVFPIALLLVSFWFKQYVVNSKRRLQTRELKLTRVGKNFDIVSVNFSLPNVEYPEIGDNKVPESKELDEEITSVGNEDSRSDDSSLGSNIDQNLEISAAEALAIGSIYPPLDSEETGMDEMHPSAVSQQRDHENDLQSKYFEKYPSGVESDLGFTFNPALSCLENVKEFLEPIEVKEKKKIDLDGPVYSYYRWDDISIDKSQIEIQKRMEDVLDCRLIFKILDQKLYVYTRSSCYKAILTWNGTMKWTANQVVEMVMLTLLTYDIPDTDFVMELKDVAVYPPNHTGPLAILLLALKANDQGFTYPSVGAYRNSLTERQLNLYKACLDLRYPQRNRIRKAIWRGSTPGDHVISRAEHVYRERRVNLAHLGEEYPDTMDVGITEYALSVKIEIPEVRDTISSYAPIKEAVPFEDFNKYAAVIDLDGNSWSDRFSRLLTGNTPILKQEYSDWREYFSHFVSDREHVLYFKEDLSDLPETVNEVLSMDKLEKERLINNAFALAEEYLSREGVIRAMAYSLTKYSSLISWKVKMEDGYEYLPSENYCCFLNGIQLVRSGRGHEEPS